MTSGSIANIQGRTYKTTSCDNFCCGRATHYDIRDGKLYCQPHAFTINKEYRMEISNE